MSDVDGKHALFGPAHTSSGHRAAAEGRRALFSAPPRRRGTVVVECGRCQARTPVPLLELGTRLLPSVWLPLPGRAFSRLLRCPACDDVSWCRVHWRTVLS